jgi:hypothetical protein
MSKICLIQQPAGIGDIFFIQKIAKKFINEGYDVWIPVIREFEFIKDYIKVPHLHFVAEYENFPYKNLYGGGSSAVYKMENEDLFLPIQNFDRNFPGMSVMVAKYKMLGMDHSDWVDYFEFERNIERETNLINHINPEGKEFILVNRQFGSPPNSKPCPHMGGYENAIEMEYLGWDNLFDWIGLAMQAKQIHTVETSLVYILHKLGLKNVTVYSRHNPPSFSQVEGFFNKDWTYKL